MKKLYYFLLLLPSLVLAQSTNQNYVKTKVYREPSSTSISDADSTKVTVNITYYDGLGRPIQQVGRKQTPLGKDIVVPIVYDSVGRVSKKYLPLASSWNDGRFTGNDAIISNIINDYSNRFGDDGENPYSETLYESSPFSRPFEQAAPGEDWAVGNGHTIKYDYGLNTTATDERVRLFKATAEWENTPEMYVPVLTSAGDTFYDANTLLVTVMKDENWVSGKDHTTEEYKNLEGQVVLKRSFNGSEILETYYVYDQFGNLTYVLPPDVSGTITTDILNDLCYQYVYDGRNRIVEKKAPGTDWEFIIYDKLDRVVATGPAFSPITTTSPATGWLITKYDLYSRVVYTAWFSGAPTSAQRKVMQATKNSATSFNETKTTIGAIDSKSVYYTNSISPTAIKLLTVNYYDNYVFPTPASMPATVEGQDVTTATKGLLTGQWIKVYGPYGSMAGNTNSFFYDKKNRLINRYTTRFVMGGYTSMKTKLDFTGKPLYTISQHKKANGFTAMNFTDTYTYTAQGLPKAHTHRVGTGTEQLLSLNTYNELGQVTNKRSGGTNADGTGCLQKADYKYNIRGWLTDINDVDTLQVGSDPKDLFSFRISHNKPTDADAQYNGNISETYWHTANDEVLRKYQYDYDALNRMKEATYNKPDEGYSYNYYGEKVLSFDKRGNIQQLVRWGGNDTTTEHIIDSLDYKYDISKFDRLLRVIDNANDSEGFNNGSSGTNIDYTYYSNGSLKTDLNKNITEIRYTPFNMPQKITFGTGDKIEYFYDGLGTKVSKVVTQGTTVTTTDYLDGGVQYTNDVLDFIATSEGYVKNTVISGNNNYKYVFNYTDHLGNVRMSYAKDPVSGVTKILEENNYYPYGLRHGPYNTDKLYFANSGGSLVLQATGPKNYDYKLNGMEWQDELGLNMYDMPLRDYDPAIARWVIVDPVVHHGQSPYNAFDGNPVVYADPSGGETKTIAELFGQIFENGKSGYSSWTRNADGFFDYEHFGPEGYQSSTYSENGESGGGGVFIFGEGREEALAQLQASTKMIIVRLDNGKIISDSSPETYADKQLLAAMMDKMITVELLAHYGAMEDKGIRILVGDAFQGNHTYSDGTTTAYHEMNVDVTERIGAAIENPGTVVRHAIIESFIGAVIARERHISTVWRATFEDARDPNSVYSISHLTAPDQGFKGGVYYYDSNSAYFWVLDKNGKKVKVQTWPQKM